MNSSFTVVPDYLLFTEVNISESVSIIPPESALQDFEKELISYYLMGISTMAICFFGLLGNILSLIVLTKRSVGGSTTNTYLISLAIADLLVLFASILIAIKDSRRPVQGKMLWLLWQDAPIIPRVYPLCHATAILFQVTSVWLTVAFAADRYFMICHPFVAKRWCTLKLTKIVITLIYLLSLIYNIPRYFEYTTFEVNLPFDPFMSLNENYTQNSYNFLKSHNNDTNYNNKSFDYHELDFVHNFTLSKSVSIIWYQLTEFGQSERFRKGYHLWSWLFFVVGIPFLLIAFMNTFLIMEVRKSSKKCVEQTKDKTVKRQDTNIMLIGVIIIFFICHLPAALSHITWAFITAEHSQKLSWFILNEIGNLLIVVNSAVNLLLYFLFSRKFRRHFLHMFCPYRLVRDNGLHCVHIPSWALRSGQQDDSENIVTNPMQHRLSIRNMPNLRRNSYRYSISHRSRPSLPSNYGSKNSILNFLRPIINFNQKSRKLNLAIHVKPIHSEGDHSRTRNSYSDAQDHLHLQPNDLNSNHPAKIWCYSTNNNHYSNTIVTMSKNINLNNSYVNHINNSTINTTDIIPSSTNSIVDRKSNLNNSINNLNLYKPNLHVFSKSHDSNTSRSSVSFHLELDNISNLKQLKLGTTNYIHKINENHKIQKDLNNTNEKDDTNSNNNNNNNNLNNHNNNIKLVNDKTLLSKHLNCTNDFTYPNEYLSRNNILNFPLQSLNEISSNLGSMDLLESNKLNENNSF